MQLDLLTAAVDLDWSLPPDAASCPEFSPYCPQTQTAFSSLCTLAARAMTLAIAMERLVGAVGVGRLRCAEPIAQPGVCFCVCSLLEAQLS